MHSQNLILSQLTADQLATFVSNEIIEKLRQLLPETPQQPVKKSVDTFLTRKQVASQLGVSLPTLRKYTITGKLPAYRIARQVRYKQTEVDAALVKIKTT